MILRLLLPSAAGCWATGAAEEKLVTQAGSVPVGQTAPLSKAARFSLRPAQVYHGPTRTQPNEMRHYGEVVSQSVET